MRAAGKYCGHYALVIDGGNLRVFRRIADLDGVRYIELGTVSKSSDDMQGHSFTGCIEAQHGWMRRNRDRRILGVDLKRDCL